MGAPLYNQLIDKNELFRIVDRTEIARGPHCQENPLIERIAWAPGNMGDRVYGSEDAWLRVTVGVVRKAVQAP